MNVNCKVSLTDEERNRLYQNWTGKNTKRMVSRAEVNEIVSDHIVALLKGRDIVLPEPEQIEAQQGLFSASVMDHPDVHEETRRINAALLNRINRLQHFLDTRK